MDPLILGNLFSLGGKLIEKIFPDPAERARAQAELVALQQTGQLKELELQLSAIIADAKSTDPWTSRARPSFLYVMYTMILAAIPMGVLHALNPALAVSIAEGMKAWLTALPEELWWLFGTGYLGYIGGRTLDKRNQWKHLGG